MDGLDDSIRDNEYPDALRIARLNGTGLPPVTARGLGEPPSGTADLESKLAQPRISLPRAASVSPLEQRTLGDEQELQRLQKTGSGISQIKNPVGRGILRGLETVGSVLSAPVTAMIPGTELHHNLLVNQERGRVAGDIRQQSEEASAAKANADTEEAQARARSLDAATAAAGQPKPKEESWKVVPGVIGPGGKVLQEEQNSGQLRWGNGIEGVGPLKETPDKEETPQQQAFKGYIAQGLTPMQAFEKIREKPVNGEEGTWQLGEDASGKPILWNSKTGAQRDSGGIAKPGTHAKAEEMHAGEDQAINYAKDYIDRGVFTGSGDEALQEKFFELAKPKTGFRMSQPQMDMLRNSRSWMTGLEAHIRHATTGTWFSQEQRQQIYETMQQLAKARSSAGSTPEPSANTQRLTDNGVVYNIPADQVQAFKRDHPNAK